MPAAVSENALGTLFGAAQRTADAVRGAKSVDRLKAARTDNRKAALRRGRMKVPAGKAGSSHGTARRGERLSGRNHRLTGPPRRQRDAGRGTPVLWHLRAREWQNGRGRQQCRNWPDRVPQGTARVDLPRSTPGKGDRPTRPGPKQARVGLAAMSAPFAFGIWVGLTNPVSPSSYPAPTPEPYHLLQNSLPRVPAAAILRANVPPSANGPAQTGEYDAGFRRPVGLHHWRCVRRRVRAGAGVWPRGLPDRHRRYPRRGG